MEETETERMSSALRAWMSALREYPGWLEWKGRQIGHTLSMDDLLPPAHEPVFEFSEEIEKQHAVISHYVGLQATILSLKDCEHYFRRYPFRHGEVTRDGHLTNTCEMYFGRFYEFKNRLKTHFASVRAMSTLPGTDVGVIIRHFEKVFDQELRARNGIHHGSRFDDLAISRLFLAGITSSDEARRRQQIAVYRKVSKEWAERVRKRGKMMDQFLEIVAAVTLKHCEFLQK